MGYSKIGNPGKTPDNLDSELVEDIRDVLDQTAWYLTSDIVEKLEKEKLRSSVRRQKILSYLRTIKQDEKVESLYFDSQRRLWRLKSEDGSSG